MALLDRSQLFQPMSERKDKATEWKDFLRASGKALCEVCKQPLYAHEQPLKASCPSMIEDCAGKWWKL